MEGIDLGPALMPVLVTHLACQAEQGVKRASQCLVAIDLAADISDQPPQPRAQESEHAPGPLELVGMGIAPDHDGSPLADPQIALAQRHFLRVCQGHQLLDRPMTQAGIGWMGNRLGLDGRVRDHPLQILRLPARRSCERPTGSPAAAPPGSPLPAAHASGHRRALEGQLVAEPLLATEVLVIGVLQPARAQHLIRQLCVCLRMNSPATSRVGSPDWLRPRFLSRFATSQ